MVYNKPELRLVADALGAIQAHQKPQNGNPDTGSDPRPTNAAYEADE
jgi:hypothetical protein